MIVLVSINAQFGIRTPCTLTESNSMFNYFQQSHFYFLMYIFLYCRVGPKEDFFHCDICNACLSTSLKGNHKVSVEAKRKNMLKITITYTQSS